MNEWRYTPSVQHSNGTGTQQERNRNTRKEHRMIGKHHFSLTSMGWRHSSSMSTLRFVCRLRWWKPNSCSILTPSSHSRQGRIVRVRTHWTCLIGGSQTVQHYRNSRTCSVQCWPTHPTLVHLSVSLPSSIRLTMTIRRSLTLIVDYIELSIVMKSQFK